MLRRPLWSGRSFSRALLATRLTTQATRRPQPDSALHRKPLRRLQRLPQPRSRHRPEKKQTLSRLASRNCTEGFTLRPHSRPNGISWSR
jgi:hypothetical protein